MQNIPLTLAALEQVKKLAFAGRYSEAIIFLRQQSRPNGGFPAVWDYWNAVVLVGLGEYEKAEQIALRAIQRGYSGANGIYAVAQRCQNKRMDWLLDFPLDELELDPFDSVMLIKEVAGYHYKRGDWLVAQTWFERASQTARMFDDAHPLIAAVAQWHAQLLRDIGQDAAAVHTVREGLRYAISGRRQPLLLEGAIALVNLGDLHGATEMLTELRVSGLSERSSAEGRLLSLLTMLEGKLAHIDGQLEDALTLYNNAYHLSVTHGGDSGYYACVYGAFVQLERGRFTARGAESEWAADVWLMLAEEQAHEVSDPARAWLRCATALIERTERVTDPEAPDAIREQTAVCLVNAEIDLTRQASRSPAPMISLRDALTHVSELGSAASFKMLLRVLPRVRSLLEQLETSDPLRGLLDTRPPAPRVVARDGAFWCGGQTFKVTRHAVSYSVAEFMQSRGSATLEEILNKVFAGRDRKVSRDSFHQARRSLLAEAGMQIELTEDGTYTMCWTANTAPDPYPKIVNHNESYNLTDTPTGTVLAD